MHTLFRQLASAAGGHQRKRLQPATVMAVLALVVFLGASTQGLARNSAFNNHHGAATVSGLAPSPAVHGYPPVAYFFDASSEPLQARSTDGMQGDDAWLRDSALQIAATPAATVISCSPSPLPQRKETRQDRSRPPPGLHA